MQPNARNISTTQRTPTYRGRFAPSPTGPLHFGSLIAAVGSYLQAKTQGGIWLVRIEDLDPPREIPGAADDILRTLEAFGLCWDEPVVYQSRRHEEYEAAIDRLAAEQFAYPCSCSRKEIAAITHAGPGGPVYPGTCRLKPRTRKKRYAIRLRTDNTPIHFRDGVQGELSQRLESESGDFVIKRADGLYAYQLAVVIDDAWQGITEIVRGCDLYHLTPRQIHLQQLLKLATPHYLHLPVATNSQGEKLSKQTGAPALNRHKPVEQLHQVLGFLGQAPPAGLASASMETFWQWALENWRPHNIPANEKIVWEPKPV